MSSLYTPVLPRFRSRWAAGMQITAMICMILQPLTVNSYWSDTNLDGAMDTWTDPASGNTYTLAALDALNSDIDDDNALNAEELQYGSNPFVFDTDGDGLCDGDEIHLANQQAVKNYSLIAWDSNGDLVSDHDDFYGYSGVTYSNGQLPTFAGASYSDYDGDGVKNPFDSYPHDPTNNDADGDTVDDSTDPDTASSDNTSPYNGISWQGNVFGDADSDSISNYWDADPYDSNNGSQDSDGDGVSNQDDPYPDDHSNLSYYNYIYWHGDLFGDADADSLFNYLDPYPYDSSNGNSSGNTDSDTDGIQNENDPYPWDQSNFSSTNGLSWFGDVLGDADTDGTPNYLDAWPYDSNNGNTGNPTPDSDGDGLTDDVDPYISDSSNYSSTNYIYWGSAVLGDNDTDGVLNHLDAWPDDAANGVGPDTDADDDGIEDDLDPAPADITNHSSTNQIDWEGYALEDLDSDGLNNFNDPFPWNPYDNLPDYDGDGILNNIDPDPKNAVNHSSINNTNWYGYVFADYDADGIPNYYDEFPSSFADADGDGLSDTEDAYPITASNINLINGVLWIDANGLMIQGTNQPCGPTDDSDLDGAPNDSDSSPFPLPSPIWDQLDHDGDGTPDPPPEGYDPNLTDGDGDGLTDLFDPYSQPIDESLFALFVMGNWGIDLTSPNGRATVYYFGDADRDGVRNFEDLYPTDPFDGYTDFDGDGIANEYDPRPSNYSNLSFYNNIEWFSGAVSDDDNDQITNFYDPRPYESDQMDSDGDGFLDLNDPRPNHADNTSPHNGLTWWSNIFGDEDGDGIQNFYDTTPNAPTDTDQDGLSDIQEALLGTSPEDMDSDDDGLTDGEEYNIYDSNPLDKHSLSKRRGWNLLYKDYELADLTDTDEDGIPDRVERFYGLNEGWDVDALHDLDQNGITNLLQYNLGIALNAELILYDTDGDGMSDVFEDSFQLDRNNRADAVEDADGDGVLNIEERLLALRPDSADSQLNGTALGDMLELILSVRYPNGGEPMAVDGDGDNQPDWAEVLLAAPSAPDFYHFTRMLPNDLDGDGLPDLWEHEYGKWKHPSNGLQIRVADGGIHDDNDGDGLPNHWEFLLGTNPLAGDTNNDGTDDGEEDSDGDGLSNAQELALGTSLSNADSDGDGSTDGQEATAGTDPMDASSNLDALLGLQILSAFN